MSKIDESSARNTGSIFFFIGLALTLFGFTLLPFCVGWWISYDFGPRRSPASEDAKKFSIVMVVATAAAVLGHQYLDAACNWFRVEPPLYLMLPVFAITLTGIHSTHRIITANIENVQLVILFAIAATSFGASIYLTYRIFSGREIREVLRTVEVPRDKRKSSAMIPFRRSTAEAEAAPKPEGRVTGSETAQYVAILFGVLLGALACLDWESWSGAILNQIRRLDL
ncbi:hypothetical protein [Streptomyces boncukensis]|uniref:Uncharacterized protein n=1 Tax=Streptomyces boncukensis TaxID=2711219 RepID=A0A6G4X2N2_9ACTN|nr:hypothetical protein [Streptomyces boncukensis]NGO71140.1 hypothetical protein [Streptomyces boncukensis]